MHEPIIGIRAPQNASDHCRAYSPDMTQKCPPFEVSA
jgi:hypothetical protein